MLLEKHLHGETASNYFARIKQIIRLAYDEQLFRRNPAEKISVRQQAYIIRDILNPNELRVLMETPINNDILKRAFLFSSLTGLRFCDVSKIKWSNIKGDRLIITQQKTQKPLTIPLTGDTLKLLGEPTSDVERVFGLPSHNACMKWLKKWVSRAGIEKKITWHCARHSFGTNLIENGVDVAITSKLLGHSSLAHTMRYLKVSEKLKEEAINKLPTIY